MKDRVVTWAVSLWLAVTCGWATLQTFFVAIVVETGQRGTEVTCDETYNIPLEVAVTVLLWTAVVGALVLRRHTHWVVLCLGIAGVASAMFFAVGGDEHAGCIIE